MKTNGKQSAALLLARLLLGRRHGNSVFCGEQFAGLYSQRATQTAQQPTTNGVHIRQKAPLLFFAQIAIQGNHSVEVESGGVKPIPMRDHVSGTVTRRSVGLAVVGVILVKICLCALPDDGAQRRACIHAVADINRAVLGNILRLDAVRQTVRDLNRHWAALNGRGDQFIHLVFGGRRYRSAARLCNVEHLADIIPGSLSAVILVHMPHNGRVTFLAGTDMHVVFLAFDTVIRRPLKLDAVERVNIIYSNAAALVIPLVQALLGSEYVVYSCAFVIVQLILLWTHASACLQGSTKLEWKKILTNVNLIAIVAGALLYLLHISLPAPIVSTLSSVGNMIGPMGMLLAGMAIAEVPLKKVFCTLRNYLPVVLRLLVVPVIVLLLLRVVHAAGWISDGKAILMTVYLSAITPSCATVTSMAQLYNRDAAHSSALYVLSTLLSIFTMPLMIGLFEVLI